MAGAFYPELVEGLFFWKHFVILVSRKATHQDPFPDSGVACAPQNDEKLALLLTPAGFGQPFGTQGPNPGYPPYSPHAHGLGEQQ